MSLVANRTLLREISFPRLIIPISAVLPALVVVAFVTALGVGLWFSALNVSYRDVQYVVPFLVQLGLFASGVVFAAQTVSEPWRTILGLNPMAGVIEGFRWALLRTSSGFGPMLAVSVSVSLLLFASGLVYFRRMERSFADVV